MASNLPAYHVVCEGPTDYRVIEAAIAAMLDGADFVLQRVQPPESLYGGDAGPYGGGWKGVRAWCQTTCEEWGTVGSSRPGLKTDLLIIHLDAETAKEAEVNCDQPCPPARDTAQLLEHALLGWMGDAAVPNWIVFCLPSRDSDAWVLVALYPNDPWAMDNVECRERPAERLLNKPEKLVRRRNEKLQKNAANYQAQSQRITNAWAAVADRCTQARRFQEDFAAKK